MASKSLAKGLKRSALTVALGFCFIGGVQAQSTTGSIYGTVPSGEGSTVVVSNNSGFSRTVTADASGRFNIGTLPVGNYTVTAARGGQSLGTRTVTVLAGSGADASFGDATTLETVTVTGANIAPIDITAVDTRSILTSEQLERLPLRRTAEAVALLAPGAVSGAAGFFGGLVSFGGSGISENAYYINGYFSGDPLSNLGGFSLPYGSIEQQDTFIGGYGAPYGRSAGGVISQLGKRGTNEWAFGGEVSYTPENLRGDQVDRYFPSQTLPAGYTYTDSSEPGQLFSRGAESNDWRSSYSLYAGGPILKDRLFFFAGAELLKRESIAAPTALGLPRSTRTEVDDPKLYAKIDWNITDDHLVELTYMREDREQEGTFRDYNFATGVTGAALATVPTPNKQHVEYTIAKYTGYLMDNLTLSILAGHGRFTNQSINPSIIPGLPLINLPTNQNPAITGGTPRTNPQGGFQALDARDYTDGLRADLEWIVGDHALTLGVDNIKFEALNEGTSQVAENFTYRRTTGNINPFLGVGRPVTATNPNGYYVDQLRFFTNTSMELDQKAYYLQDRWQVTDNFLLSLGIRNDSFTNTNNFGEAYLEAKNQWAPRLGFSWDVLGDSSMKVFGNAGRYFLALPNNVAIRGASASTFTREYFTYTGIDAQGRPTGLTGVPRLDGAPPRPVSSNGEFGQPIDVLSFAPSDLKSIYQDEFILGMEKTLGERWMIGAKLSSRDLKSSVDDICDAHRMENAVAARGVDPATLVIPGCFMFNPGGTNTFSLARANGSGRYEITMTPADWGIVNDLKRHYSGLDLYLERTFDGVWEARVDYTFSKSRGNTEGQVKSEFGQSNISKTQDWDAAEIMAFADGYLANDRRHQFKARGSWQLAEEWLVGANLRIESGMPIGCLGFFNPNNSPTQENEPEGDPIGYGASYHTCFGQPVTPGSIRTPWTKTIDMGVTYRPLFLDKKLALGVQVLNALNDRKTLQVDVTSEDDPYTVSNTYLLPIGLQAPRSVVFTASYDF